MYNLKKLVKITVILVFITFIGKFIYISVILPLPFKHELEICIKNSQKLKDSLAVDIAKELCLDVYPHI